MTAENLPDDVARIAGEIVEQMEQTGTVTPPKRLVVKHTASIDRPERTLERKAMKAAELAYERRAEKGRVTPGSIGPEAMRGPNNMGAQPATRATLEQRRAERRAAGKRARAARRVGR